jgi:8-oxo-dGTP diphosphatase
MTRYCLGFAFNENETDVLLIEKNHPKWQAGKFNGVGGKCDVDENSIWAMRREFKEETGIDIELDGWKYIISMYGEDWHVDVFSAFTDGVFNFQSIESEQVHLLNIKDIQADKYDVISNLYWLIPMCLDKNDDHKSGINYYVGNQVFISAIQPAPSVQ